MRQPSPATVAAIQRALQTILVKQRRLVTAWLNDTGGRGEPPNLKEWSGHMVEALRPMLFPIFQQGFNEMGRQLATGPLRFHRGIPRRGGAFIALTVKKDLPGAVFDLFNPRILTAVDAALFAFCDATNETSIVKLEDAISWLRHEIKEGLAHGEALKGLSARVYQIFDDPNRAGTIAQTEASRAVHGGQFIAAQEHGVKRKRWVVSSDACDLCKECAARGDIPLDEPFHVDPKGGPYAMMNYPPAHPHCYCTWTPVF